MQSGFYRLTKTVANPNGDGRCTDRYWRRPEWEKGDRFAIYPPEDGHFNLSDDNKFLIEPLQGNHEQRVVNGKLDDFSHLILPHLEPIPETVDSYIYIKHYTKGGVLDLLIKYMHINLDNIKSVIRLNEDAIKRRKK